MLKDPKVNMLLITLLLRHLKGVSSTLEKYLDALKKDNPQEFMELLEKVKDAKTK